MQAIKVHLIAGVLVYVNAESPLAAADSRQALLDIRRKEGPVLFCLFGESVEFILEQNTFLNYHPLKSRHSRLDRVGHPNFWLFEAPRTQYKDLRKPPASMVTAIKSLLTKAREEKKQDLYLMTVREHQFSWLQAQVQDPDGRHDNDEKETEGDENEQSTPDAPVHPHAYDDSLLEDGDAVSLETFRFEGEMKPYPGPLATSPWGSFYIDNERRSERKLKLTQEECPYCSLILAENAARPMLRFTFGAAEYFLVHNENPIVTGQYRILASPSNQGEKASTLDRSDITETDIRLARHLTLKGLSGLPLEQCGDAAPITFEGCDPATPLAVAVNPLPKSGQTLTHFHMHAMPASHIPLPAWTVEPWEISIGTTATTVIRRIAGAPFYAIAVRDASWKPSGHLDHGTDEVSRTITKIHAHLNQQLLAYNLLVYPVQLARGEVETMIVLVPRAAEIALGQRIGGIELITGALIPSSEFADRMDPVMRDRAFRQVTLNEKQILQFERNLRGMFGLPPAGKAVYPVKKTDGTFSVSVKENSFHHAAAANEVSSYWTGTRVPEADGRRTDEESDDPNERNILVRITHASISHADRRFLQGTRVRGKPDIHTCTGHEGGARIVDAGRHTGRFYAGQKVALVPHLICGHCDLCRNFKGNLCSSFMHMGYDFDGAFTQLTALSAASLLPVDDRFPEEALPLIEPLACTLHALFRCRDRLYRIHNNRIDLGMHDHPFTVFGGGPIGAIATLALQRFYPEIPITVIDPHPKRREIMETCCPTVTVRSSFPDGHSCRVSIVTSNTLDSYRQAIKTIANDGSIVIFAGLNIQDLDHPEFDHKRLATELQNIHINEDWQYHNPAGGPSHTRIGSSGYNNHDLRRSVMELQRHYAQHYSKAQNLIINGLNADRAYKLGSSQEVFPNGQLPIIEALLAADGLDDAQHGTLIAETHKALIII